MDKLLQRYPNLGEAFVAPTDGAVKRMMQSVAARNARAARQPGETGDPLLGACRQDALLPMPSCAVVQAEGAGSRVPVTIPRGTELLTKAQPACRFRTVYDVAIAPVAITSVRFIPCVHVPLALGVPENAACAIAITIESTDSAVALDEALAKPLRVFVDADDATRAAFHDALFMRTLCTCVQAARQWCQLAASPFVPVGYDDGEAVLPTQAGTASGLRLLAEYFAFPDKFAFLDVDLKAALARSPAGTRRLLLHVMLPALSGADLLESLSPAMLRLGCTPIVNLFKRAAEPLHLAAGRNTYPLRPFPVVEADATLYSVDGVTVLHTLGGGNMAAELPRFDPSRGSQDDRFWLARRADTAAGAEHTISFVDGAQVPFDLSGGTVAVQLTCTNGDVPARLPIGRPDGDLAGDGAAARYPVRLLRRPSFSRLQADTDQGPREAITTRPCEQRKLPHAALPALLDMLRVHAPSDNGAVQRQLAGIVGLEQRATKAWVRFPQGAAYMQGTQVRLTIDEAAFDRCGVFAFAQVMDRVFTLYAQAEGFAQLVVVTTEGEERVRFGPRTGVASPM
ncbi:type VI secretion system baseplate subunit TssF [Massilia sp. METH4]|uniref:type VI secretion system baseplate subunit TssF n=1 Tax=Massilia sp. METH4 TaxID=3123041 RepID=UPI0030D4AE99